MGPMNLLEWCLDHGDTSIGAFVFKGTRSVGKGCPWVWEQETLLGTKSLRFQHKWRAMVPIMGDNWAHPIGYLTEPQPLVGPVLGRTRATVPSHKACGPYTVTSSCLSGIWRGSSWLFENTHQKDTWYDEIGLRVCNMIIEGNLLGTIVGSNNSHVWARSRTFEQCRFWKGVY